MKRNMWILFLVIAIGVPGMSWAQNSADCIDQDAVPRTLEALNNWNKIVDLNFSTLRTKSPSQSALREAYQALSGCLQTLDPGTLSGNDRATWHLAYAVNQAMMGYATEAAQHFMLADQHGAPSADLKAPADAVKSIILDKFGIVGFALDGFYTIDAGAGTVNVIPGISLDTSFAKLFPTTATLGGLFKESKEGFLQWLSLYVQTHGKGIDPFISMELYWDNFSLAHSLNSMIKFLAKGPKLSDLEKEPGLYCDGERIYMCFYLPMDISGVGQYTIQIQKTTINLDGIPGIASLSDPATGRLTRDALKQLTVIQPKMTFDFWVVNRCGGDIQIDLTQEFADSWTPLNPKIIEDTIIFSDLNFRSSGYKYDLLIQQPGCLTFHQKIGIDPYGKVIRPYFEGDLLIRPAKKGAIDRMNYCCYRNYWKWVVAPLALGLAAGCYTINR